ncbi:hypothetical protein ACSDR0_22065 [Streptosporangium sp. G11]|uniref:hypothetical protein n=1 Tax=Streptosporangium sp. G11 TaxID=3436926 RepID=UPI003EB88F9C
MTKIRNALAAGVMTASALIVPAAISVSSATADTVATTAPSTLTSVLKPCRKHKNPDRCRARRGHRHGYGRHERGRHDYGRRGGEGRGVGVGGGISDDLGGRGTGRGIDN